VIQTIIKVISYHYYQNYQQFGNIAHKRKVEKEHNSETEDRIEDRDVGTLNWDTGEEWEYRTC